MHQAQPDLPIWGDIIWLTPEQGGRASGPPPTPWDTYYYATAFVPPFTFESSLASIVLNVAVRDGWTSQAKAGWLVPPGPAVDEGSVFMITEGPRTVAVFTVTHVERKPGAVDQSRQPLSGQAITAIEARAAAATRGPWQSIVEGRDQLSGASFILTGADDERGPDLYLTWDPRVSEDQRLADQDFIAHARQDIPDMAADLRDLREWHELVDDDDAPDDEDSASDRPEGYQPPSVAYIVQTDPDLPNPIQVAAFTSKREALKALYRARSDRPSESWVINSITVWDRFTDHRSES